jgi:Na+-translocating ferredoxin:NAD+ oxidoreductase subunit B
MQAIVTAGLIMMGLALFFGVVLAVAYRYLRVQEDPRLDVVEGMLPGSNCGACGQPGCRAFAEAVVQGQQKPGACTVSSPDGLAEIAAFLGVDAGEQEKRVARLHCAGGESLVTKLAEYDGVESCRAAVVVNGGSKACAWGCLGLADCERACTFDAIHMNTDGLPVVDVTLCTACNDCVEVCPRDLFTLEPLDHKLLVQCASPLAGELARSICVVACDACGRCALDAGPNVIEMVGGLPVIRIPEATTPVATFRCPTGAIQWVDGNQFDVEPPVRVRTPLTALLESA